MDRFPCLNRLLTIAILVMASGSSQSFAQTSTLSHGPSIDAIRAKGVLTIGVCDDPPWSMNSAINIGSGVIPDMMLAFAAREGIAKVDMQPMPFASFIGALTSGRIDIAADTLTPNPARAEIIDFPDDVVFDPGGLIVAPGNPLHVHQNADLTNGIRVSAFEGALYGKALLADIARGQKIKVFVVPGFNEAVNAVVSGQVDAALVDAVNAEFALKQNPDLRFELVPDFNPTGTRDKAWLSVMPNGTVADVGFAKSQPDLTAAWNKDFAAMSKEGVIDKIFEKYGLTPSKYVASPSDPAYVKP